MSAQDFLTYQKRLHTELLNPPECWVLLANTFGRAEDNESVALFDTKELGDAYVAASKLPDDWHAAVRNPSIDGFFRTYRPDSLLWDFNPLYHQEMVYRVRLGDVLRGYGHLPVNPDPPMQPITEVVEELKARVADKMLRESVEAVG